MKSCESRPSWNIFDIIQVGPLNSSQAGTHTLLDIQTPAILIENFEKEITSTPDKRGIFKGILELSKIELNHSTLTRVLLKVDQDGTQEVVGMDWIGFVDETFFISPPVFKTGTTHQEKRDFRAQAFSFNLEKLPTQIILATTQQTAKEKEAIRAIGLKRIHLGESSATYFKPLLGFAFRNKKIEFYGSKQIIKEKKRPSVIRIGQLFNFEIKTFPAL